ncbi:MAG: hypothetical protein JW909_12340 [Planctomycetes bacterium]|nr:hypothetical protein [Planctomycetota bacterium]
MKRCMTLTSVLLFAVMPLLYAADAASSQVAADNLRRQAEQEQALRRLMASAKREQSAPPFANIVENENVKVSDLAVKGHIEGENITFRLTCKVDSLRRRQEIPLFAGDLVLMEVVKPQKGSEIRYDKDSGVYYMSWPRGGKYDVEVTFACRPTIVGDGDWRETTFYLPSSNMRELEVVCDRTDLEVVFPGSMRFGRKVEENVLTVTAVMGSGRPFTVRWKPKVQELDAKLVFGSQANTVAVASAGALRMNNLFVFDISQGKLSEVAFKIPGALNVTQVRGAYIRDWQISTEGDERRLLVKLNRPRTSQYALEVVAEQAVSAFPASLDLPVIEPLGVIRAGGYLTVGTDSAIRLMMNTTGGLSQIDNSAFPRIVLDREHPRHLPGSNAFYYMYATTPYQVNVTLSDIVPAYDASSSLAMSVREDDLVMTADMNLDIREAPIRNIVVEIPAGFMVSSVQGALVDDYTVRSEGASEVEVHFSRPVLGTTLVNLRLELGKSPVGAALKIAGFKVRGAKNERGDIVIGAEEGVDLDAPRIDGLREVHAGSITTKLPDPKFAYRFRSSEWSMEMNAKEKSAGIGVEGFHLMSLGDGVLYGSVTILYFISGAPVDEFHFRIPKEFQNVEFISKDVRRWSNNGEHWTVFLQQKVIGHYELLVTYNLNYDSGDTVVVGGVECEQVDTQTGFIVVASRQNLKLTPKGSIDTAMLEVDREEVPYNLSVNAPMLKTYKYVGAPHRASIEIKPYDQGELLAVVVEMAELDTQLSVLKDGHTESLTTARYMIKNTNSQFLAVDMPKDATGVQVHSVGADGTTARIPASFDAREQRLLVPLDRNPNPNKPMTVTLKYGQSHGELGWGGRLLLVAPKGNITSTFSRWTLSVSGDRELIDPAGNMVPDSAYARRRGLSAVALAVVQSLEWGLSRIIGFPQLFVVLFILLAVAAVKRRAPIRELAVCVLVAAWLIVGVFAAFSKHMPGDTGRRVSSLVFTQVLDTGEQESLSVGATLVPVWRRDATLFGAVLVPLLSVAAVVSAVARDRRRKALIAFAVAGIVFAMAQFPVGAAVLGHLLTYGVPAAAVVYLVGRGRFWNIPSRTVASAAFLLAFLSLGCASRAAALEDSEPPVLESVECTLVAEDDSMSVKLTLSIDSRRPVTVPVMPKSAILLTDMEAVKRVFKVEEDRGMYYLSTVRGGKHDIGIEFLMPLPKAQDDQISQFSMPLPLALRNKVSLDIPKTGLEVESPTAMLLTREEVDGVSKVKATVGPGDDVFFIWRPRARQRSLEATSFYAQISSLVFFDTGLAECRHDIRLQIAQGELKDIVLSIPQGMTVTSVDGADVGAWRFDPATRNLEAHLSKPAIGEYTLHVVTQISRDSLPYEVTIGIPEVKGAVNQRGVIGLASSQAVSMEIGSHPMTMNVDDFARDSTALMSLAGNLQSSDVRYAFRHEKTGETLTAKIQEVRPEIRAEEDSIFDVDDDKLILKGRMTVAISKAGVFSISLLIPKGYDIDALHAPEVSHWDEKDVDGRRVVTVHLNKRFMGAVRLDFGLSSIYTDLPRQLDVPRVEVVNALKHSGKIIVKSHMGVRLAVASRDGVSELNPVELGIREQGWLAFRLLRPSWNLKLNTEVIQPRVMVDFLHVARVAEGLVRHNTYLRYNIHNAGVKVFTIEVPADAMGLDIVGPYIANVKEVPGMPGRRRVELVKKWVPLGTRLSSGPYPLTVRYETQFDRAKGRVRIEQARALDVDLQKGFIAVYATEKVEVSSASKSDDLQVAEARNIPRSFGSGDLSGAAFCFTSTRSDYNLEFDALRHESADLLQANVSRIDIVSLATESGMTLNRVDMDLMVGGKRYLETRLPRGARIWTLLVGGGSVIPSVRTGDDGRELILVPLGQAAQGEIPVQIQFIYVSPPPEGWRTRVPKFQGPEFDLPLRNVSWLLYMPPGYKYGDFEGTLTFDRYEYPQTDTFESILLRAQQTQVQEERKVKELLDKAQSYASAGEQWNARQAFEMAGNMSVFDRDLNEDARVKGQKLQKQQVIVNVLGRRTKMRPSYQLQGTEARLPGIADLGENFSAQQAERVQNSLDKEDNDNLELIAQRMLGQQEAAAGFNWPLRINMVERGKGLRFQRALQVSPDTEMAVWFDARPVRKWTRFGNLAWGLGLFAVILAVFSVRILGAPRSTAPAGRGRRNGASIQPPPLPSSVEDSTPSAEEPAAAEEAPRPGTAESAPRDDSQQAPGEAPQE